MKRTLASILRRGLSLVLALALVFSSFPSYTLAYLTPKPDALVVIDQEGNETIVDATWEEIYPYGIFAFEKRELEVSQGGESQVIKVYRLGGTTGRAHLDIVYAPAYTEVGEGVQSYDNAAGKNDIIIEVEETLPFAWYQPLGIPPVPREPENPVAILFSWEEEQGVYIYELEEVTGESYSWYIWYDGDWSPIQGADQATLLVAPENHLEAGYDYMCVYTVEGIQYGSNSAWGDLYLAPEADFGEYMHPSDLADLQARNYQQTFAVLPMDDPDEFSAYIFEMVFAEGEWVKEIRISAPDNREHKPDTFGYLQMVGYQGAGIYQDTSAVVIQVVGDAERYETMVGFTAETVRFDKSAGSAYVTVTRTGDTTYPVSFAWRTEDISALAGVDYATAGGTISLYADVSSATLEIPLIENGIYHEEDLRLAVVLDNLLGGGTANLATFSQDTIYIDLYNTVTLLPEERNLATILYDASLVDVSSLVTVDANALVADPPPVTGERVEASAGRSYNPPAELVFVEQYDTVTSRSYTFAAELSFASLRNLSDYNSKYWNDIMAQHVSPGYTPPANSNSFGQFGWWSSGSNTYSGGNPVVFNNLWGLYNQKPMSMTLNIPHVGKRFNYISYSNQFQHRMNYGVKNYGTNYILEPRIEVPVTSSPIVQRMYANNNSKGTTSTWYGQHIPLYGDYGYQMREMDDYWNMYYYTLGSGSIPFTATNSSVMTMSLIASPMKGYKPPKSGNEHMTNNFAEVGLRYLGFNRNSFTNNIALRIYTANDNNAAYTQESDKATITLQEATADLYAQIQPQVTIVEKGGGVTSSGSLYVGSKLQISTAALATYQLYWGVNIAGVYLTQRQGNNDVIVARGSLTGSNNFDVATIELIWDSMVQEDLRGKYTLNIVLERSQHVVVELLPSVPRLTEGPNANGINIDERRIPDAFQMFKDSNSNIGITIFYSDYRSLNSNVGASQEAVSFELKARSALLPIEMPTGYNGSNTAFAITDSKFTNIQSINFNLSPEDIILYSGKAYKGNETITIMRDHMNQTAMAFRYYHKDYLTAQSVMVPLISDIALYLDRNNDGKISGSYRQEDNLFHLDGEGLLGDLRLEYLTFASYEETIFAPKLITQDQENNPVAEPYYANHMIALDYTITPRCLVLPADAKESDRAQANPVFTTSANNVNSLSKMTREQKGYRYVEASPISITSKEGVVTSKSYSSDSILMYGAEASAPQALFFSAGGDISPVGREQGSSTNPNPYTWPYVWRPDFKGSLLFPFEHPEPVAIENSLAGSNIPIAQFTRGTDGVYNYERTGNPSEWAKINGYLGSLSGVDTFALTIAQQPYQRDEETLVPQGELAAPPMPESSLLAGIALFPNADYLLVTNSPEEKPEKTADSSGGDHDEFGIDMGVKLPNIEIGLSDYITIILDGYDIGFAIGLPLGGFEKAEPDDSNPPGSSGSQPSKVKSKNPVTANKENGEKFKNFITGSWGKLTKDDAYNKAKQEKASPSGKDANGNPAIDKGKMSSSTIQVSFSLRLAFMFSYNPLDNGYYFSKFAISVAVSFEFKYTYRLSVCPIVFVYIKVGVGLTLSTGLQVVREVVEGTSPVNLSTITLNSTFTLQGEQAVGKLNDYLEFTPGYKAYNVYFSGKMLIQMKQGTGNFEAFGYIASSNMDKPVTIILKQQKGYTIEGDPFDLRLVALENTAVAKIVPIVKADSDTYWSGMKLAPSALIEVGAGLGIDMLKIEIFAQLAIECAMTFGAYNIQEKAYDPFTFDSFAMKLGIGVRVVLLFFTIEKEAIQYLLNYERGRSGGDNQPWMHGYSALGGAFAKMYPLPGQNNQGRSLPSDPYQYATYSSAGSNSFIKLPNSTADTQRINSLDSQGLARAYDTYNTPFQISGFNASGDAFTLVEGLVTGYDYQVVTIGDKHYLLYHLSRPGSSGQTLDSTMLVLSEIVVADENNNYGLRHPTDPASSTEYMVVDSGSIRGDLDFNGWVDAYGNLQVVWVSYADDATALAATFTPTPDEVSTSIAVTAASGTLVYQVSPNQVQDVKIGDTVFGTTHAFTDGAYEVVAGSWFTIYELDSNQWVVAYTSYQIQAEDIGTLPTEPPSDPPDDNLGRQASLLSGERALSPRTPLEQLQDAAGNTVIKAASWHPATPGAFTPAELIAPRESNQTRFSPHTRGEVLLHFTAVPYPEPELAAAVATYEGYLKRLYQVEHLPNDDPYFDDSNIPFLKAYYETMKRVYGKSNILNISARGDDNQWYNLAVELSSDPLINRTVENSALTMIDGTLYLAYTTSEENYVAGDLQYTKRFILRSVTIDPTQSNAAEMITLGAPYQLRQLVCFEDGNKNYLEGEYSAGSLEPYTDPYFADLKFLTGKLGALDGTPEDFSPLANARAVTQEVAVETFLLFEMNGNTYVIPERDLLSITGIYPQPEAGKTSGRIIPFFTMEKYLSLTDDGNTTEVEATHSGYAGVTIGADGDGNIAAVFVGTVPNTTNNAIYISHYYTETVSTPGGGEETVAAWTPAKMLAMNQMQVYEDALSHSWSEEETKGEYLKGITADTATSNAYQFTFTNLQFALIAPDEEGSRSLSRALEADNSSWEEGELSFTSAESLGNPSSHRNLGGTSQALVLTEGALTQLYHQSYPAPDLAGGNYTAVMPAAAGEVGFYAIAFGQGAHLLGNPYIHIDNSQLTGGAFVSASLGFTNIGTTRIRGSEANPATVTLYHASPSGEEELAQWWVYDSINPGQEFIISGATVELRQNVAPGDFFYFVVKEDATYVQDAATLYSYVTSDANDPNFGLGRYLVQDLPDLALERVQIASVGVDPASGQTILDADFYVTNRGTRAAEGVLVQFKLQTGEDQEGNPTYKPLDLTDAKFTINSQEPIATLFRAPSTAIELQNGILRLHGTDNHDRIDPQFGRHITGTFYANVGDYIIDRVSQDEALIIEMELFYDGDNPTVSGGIWSVASHNELTSINNSHRALLRHQTYFTAASNIAVPLGTPLMLPLRLITTYGVNTVSNSRPDKPNLLLTQVGNNVVSGNYIDYVGTLYYDADLKCIVIAPAEEGECIIRITDIRTNTSYDIMCTVTPEGKGINVFNNNDMFTFYNSDRTDANGIFNDPYDPEATMQKWSFMEKVSDWNPDTAIGSNDIHPPYLNDLARGEAGALYTVNTLAVAMTFYFSGKLEISSTYPGFASQVISSPGGNSESKAVTVRFRPPEDSSASAITHRVTVKVLESTAYIDKYIEEYGGSIIPTPADDFMSPQLYWSQRFPGLATLAPGTTVPLTLTIIDDTGLSSLFATNFEAEGMTLEKVMDNVWVLKWTVTKNGVYDFHVQDVSGNITSRTVNVGWFTNAATLEPWRGVPEISEAKITAEGKDWTTGDIYSSAAEILLIAATSSPGAKIVAQRGRFVYDEESDNIIGFTFDAMEPDDQQKLHLRTNGIYRVRAYWESDADYFSDRYLLFNGIDSAEPIPELYLEVDSEGNPTLAYKVYKEVAGLFDMGEVNRSVVAPITEIRINEEVILAGVSGTNFGGTWRPPAGLYNGEYTLYAKDSAGNSATWHLTVRGLPLILGDDFCVVESDWTQKGGEGWVALNLAAITGGAYNPELLQSSPLNQRFYGGNYLYALLPQANSFTLQDTAAMNMAELNSYLAARDAFFAKVTFSLLEAPDSTAITGLAAGDYILYLADANPVAASGEVVATLRERNDTLVSRELNLPSEAISFTLTTTGTFVNDGTITVEAEGGIGSLDTFQFALLPYQGTATTPLED
ncbi:MAG: hypothetical protein FWF06_01820, partial [Symbiobacteriaceae bacterium]|nr:hypothetical protein [Symbiobacteriaceae bacterium]